jgi:hypothetical protein
VTEQPLYVTLEEIPALMGVGINSGRKAPQEMRKHPKFPPRSIGGKYHWPLVKDFLDIWNGRRVDVRGVPAEQAHAEISHTGRRRPALEAAQKWLEEVRLEREAAGLPPIEPPPPPIQKRKLTPRTPPESK